MKRFPPSRRGTLALLAFLLLISRGLAPIAPAHGCESASFDEIYFGTLNGFPTDKVSDLAIDQEGNVFVGTEDQGIVVIPVGKTTWSHALDTRKHLSFNAIHSLWIEPPNLLWVGTAGGLNRVDLRALTVNQAKYFAVDGLKDNICRAVSQKPHDSTLWVGTTNGLVRKAEEFKRFTEREGLPGNDVQSLSPSQEGDLWIGTTQGLARTNFSRLDPVPLEPENRSLTHWVQDLALAPPLLPDFRARLEATIGGMEQGMKSRPACLAGWEDEGPNEEVFQKIDALRRKLQGELDTALYIATSNGLFSRYAGQGVPTKLDEGWFTAVAVDTMGRAYAADRAMHILPIEVDEGTCKEYSIRAKVKVRLEAILQQYLAADDAPGEKAASVPAEIMILRGRPPEEIDAWVEKYLEGCTVSAMRFSPQGQLWVGIHGGGVYRLDPVIIHHDGVFHGVEGRRLAVAAGEAPRIKGRDCGLALTTPKPKVPPLPEIEAGLEAYRPILPPGTDIWIGRWSELKIADARKVGEFIARFSFTSCLCKLLKVLPYDPYVLIPMGDL